MTKVARAYIRLLQVPLGSLAKLNPKAAMDPDELARTCDELHEYLDQGPRENPRGFAGALVLLGRLRPAASRDRPLILLSRIELQLATWFGAEGWRGADAGQSCRQALLSNISLLEDVWDRSRS